MKTYLIIYRWRYEISDDFGQEIKKDTLATQWLSYYALFSEEMIYKSDLTGELLYKEIRKEIREKIEDGGKEKKKCFIDNIITLD